MRISIATAFICSFIGCAFAASPPNTAPFPPAIEKPGAEAFPGVIALDLDARDVGRHIVTIIERIPVSGQKQITLLYPKWLPGKHSARGPIDKLAGIEFSVKGKPVSWKRDPVEVFAFHVDLPADAKALDFRAQYLSPTDKSQGRIEITPVLSNLQWNEMLLYPAGFRADGVNVRLSLRLPKGWGYASALTPQTGIAGAGKISFDQTTLNTLVDSPMFAGRYFKRYALDANNTAPVHLNVFGESEKVLAASEEQIDLHKNLVAQADKLYKSRHFDHYDFLLAISDELGGIGLEHHQSSENSPGAAYFARQKDVPRDWSLLPHEYTHSWNGKFRRPADLYVVNYDVPMRDSLLWIYEGMTQYFGQVLSARSGIWSRETALEAMADNAATYDYRVGRQWRPVVDTTNDPIVLARRPQPWKSWQRNEDYYTEGLLVWLDADTLIREKTNGKKSLDDFAAAFFGVDDGRITPETYSFEDVVSTLNSVYSYDWASFLKSRIYDVGGKPPLDGITRGGWRLVYNDQPNDFISAFDRDRKISRFMYSIGLTVGDDQSITEVQWDSPAFNAGLTVGDKLVAISGLQFSPTRLEDAIKAAKASREPFELIVQSGKRFRTISLEYYDGLRIPHLVRDESQPDRLGDIITAK